MNRTRYFFLALIFQTVGLAAESEHPFAEVWQAVRSKSSAQKAAALEAQAASIEKNRREWHWAPRVYVEGRAYETNDPVMSFSSMLQTRNLKSSDLSVPSPLMSPQAYLNPLSVLAPDTLNHPSTNGYYRGVLGIELPVYEGGTGQARVEAAESAAKAREWEMASTVKNEYAAVAQAYGELLLRDAQDAELNSLKQILGGVLSRYQLGSGLNPVGRSGYLGMQSLRNRIEGMMANNQIRRSAARGLISALTVDSFPDLKPVSEKLDVFAGRELPVGDGQAVSERVRAMHAVADAMAVNETFERARLLPQAGVFGEASATGARRGIGDAFYAGFFVRMNILSAQDYGAADQAKKQAEAARLRAKESADREQAQLAQLLSQEEILKKNIALLDESLGMSREQIILSERLFVTGALNALQLAEVLSRRADLIDARYEAESELIRTRAARFLIAGRIPDGDTK